MTIRPLEMERDRIAARRIWQEVGWISAAQADKIDPYITAGNAWVAEMGGEAECLVCTVPGSMRYQRTDLQASFVTGVTVSRVARKQGLAGRVLARALRQDAEQGSLVSLLGMFEQGFYNRLGYGTGGYVHRIALDGSMLDAGADARPPLRLTPADAERMHALRMRRHRGHGGCCLAALAVTVGELNEEDNGFGLGYARPGTDELTHFAWCTAKNVESGPYRVMLCFEELSQLKELLALLGSLGDQVRVFKLIEPPGVQLEDLVRKPIRSRHVTYKSEFETGNRASVYWQARILDLPRCVAATSLRGDPVRFNLDLADPIEAFTEPGSWWRGVGGRYRLELGPESRCEPGTDASLPTLTASVGAFTRLWLGVRPAGGLAVTDRLSGPPELLDALDDALRLPPPTPDWDF
ncbi:MAG: GNAT family N-acetyltransferase [Armatimonadetes bacterium]|nr:GNAT family N-acetyltransferase [Armatimonadota bacterium]